jgi:hypothetical protein
MELTYPVKGQEFKSNSDFGIRAGIRHKGIDLKAKSGTPILSVLPGTVVKSDDTSDPSGYGGQILIKHNVNGKTFFSRYAHLRKRNVVANETVVPGEQIGESGGGKDDPNKGRATGPHLHFEFLDSSERPLDPKPYLTGALVAGSAALTASGSSDEKDKENDNKSNSGKNIVDKAMRTFMKGYSPIAYLSSIPGLAEPQKESKIPKPILEDIERIKQLLK